MCQKAASIRGRYETRTVEWGCGCVQTHAAPFLKSLPTSFTLREFFIVTDAQLNLAALSSLTPYRKRVNSATLLYGKHFRKVPRPSVTETRFRRFLSMYFRKYPLSSTRMTYAVSLEYLFAIANKQQIGLQSNRRRAVEIFYWAISHDVIDAIFFWKNVGIRQP